MWPQRHCHQLVTGACTVRLLSHSLYIYKICAFSIFYSVSSMALSLVAAGSTSSVVAAGLLGGSQLYWWDGTLSFSIVVILRNSFCCQICFFFSLLQCLFLPRFYKVKGKHCLLFHIPSDPLVVWPRILHTSLEAINTDTSANFHINITISLLSKYFSLELNSETLH